SSAGAIETGRRRAEASGTMDTAVSSPSVLTYEQRLRAERAWDMDEGDRHFRRDGEVFKAMRKIARRLEDLGVSYAVAGGMSLDAHGFRRLTVDVDILVTRKGLKTIHERLEGLDYVPPVHQQQEPP